MVNEKFYSAVKKLWNGRATVRIKTNEKDEETGRTTQKDVTVCENEPCRISHKTVEITAGGDNAAKGRQTTTLFIDKSVNVPTGSRITVTQCGVTQEYVSSGLPAVFDHHQQIPLKAKEEWS